MVAHQGRKMKDLFSPDSNWHDLGEVKYELLFPGRLLQFLQRDDFPKALGTLECVTYLLLPEQRVERNRLTTPFWGRQVLMEMAAVPRQRVSLQVQTGWDIADVTEFASAPRKEREMPTCFLSLQRCVLDLRSCLLHAGQQAQGWYSDWERNRTRGWPTISFLGRQSQQKGSPVAWWMVLVSRFSMCL